MNPAHRAAPVDRPDILGALVRQGAITGSAAQISQRTAVEIGRPPEYAAVELGYATEADVLRAVSAASGVPVWKPALEPAQPHLMHGLNHAFLSANLVVPLNATPEGVVVAIADPFDAAVLESLRFALGRAPILRVGASGDLRAALGASERRDNNTRSDDDAGAVDQSVALVLDAERSAPAARALATLLLRAIDLDASDIHIEPKRGGAEVRLRKDGQMIAPERVERDLAAAIVGRAKVLAEIDVAETRLPQDGRMTFVARGAPIDIRVATAPTAFGEAMTMRILHRTARLLDLEQLGFEGATLDILQRSLQRKDGLFIVAGPTGSGKTTTMYAGLSMLRDRGLKILSIEDPIEFQFEHVVQLQAAPQIGLTFATALRSMLRHDPDVLMIGEIRDPDTAAVAIQAALTGHLVLASLHARSAVGIAPRLMDLGVEPYQLSAAILGAVSQRLVRRLCDACRHPVDSVGSYQSFEASGCATCSNTGRRGRIAISESFEATDAFRQALARGAPIDQLAPLITQGPHDGLDEDIARKARAGLLSALEAANDCV